jgi:hypothetical protein
MDRVCGNCKSAKPDKFLKSFQRVCFEGYGVKNVTDADSARRCKAFEEAAEGQEWADPVVEKASDRR